MTPEPTTLVIKAVGEEIHILYGDHKLILTPEEAIRVASILLTKAQTIIARRS